MATQPVNLGASSPLAPRKSSNRQRFSHIGKDGLRVAVLRSTVPNNVLESTLPKEIAQARKAQSAAETTIQTGNSQVPPALTQRLPNTTQDITSSVASAFRGDSSPPQTPCRSVAAQSSRCSIIECQRTLEDSRFKTCLQCREQDRKYMIKRLEEAMGGYQRSLSQDREERGEAGSAQPRPVERSATNSSPSDFPTPSEPVRLFEDVTVLYEAVAKWYKKKRGLWSNSCPSRDLDLNASWVARVPEDVLISLPQRIVTVSADLTRIAKFPYKRLDENLIPKISWSARFNSAVASVSLKCACAMGKLVGSNETCGGLLTISVHAVADGDVITLDLKHR